MTGKPVLALEDRLRLAEQIVQLSDGSLKIGRTLERYIPLFVGEEYDSTRNAVTVWNNGDVSFFISADLVIKARDAGFVVKARSEKGDKYRFLGLTVADFQEHENLFRDIVKSSAEKIKARKRR